MKLMSLRTFLAALALLLATGSASLRADEGMFDVDTYMNATLARLVLVRDTLAASGATPEPQTVSALLQGFGLDSETYHRQSSRYAEEIAAYLERNPSVQQQIDGLANQIDALASSAGD